MLSIGQWHRRLKTEGQVCELNLCGSGLQRWSCSAQRLWVPRAGFLQPRGYCWRRGGICRAESMGTAEARLCLGKT